LTGLYEDLSDAINQYTASINVAPNTNLISKSGINKYSERICTNNEIVNSVLNVYFDGESFANSVISNYYKDYVNSSADFLTSAGNFNTDLSLTGAPDNFNNWIVDMLNKKSYTPNALTEGKLAQYFNLASSPNNLITSISDYLATGKAL
jgi:hypothetical protein